MAIALYYSGAAICAVPAGRLAEHLGGARLMRACQVATAVVLGSIAVGARSLVMLAVFLVMGGMVSAALQPSANLLLARRVSPLRQGLAFGVKQAAVPIATLLGGLAVPGLALSYGWRWAFAAAGVLALLAAMSVPRPLSSWAERRVQRTPTAPLALGPIACAAFRFGLATMAATGLTAFLAVSAVATGLTKSSAGLLVAAAGDATAAVRVGMGFRADRVRRNQFPEVSGLLAAGAVGFAGLAAGAAARAPALFVVGAAGAALLPAGGGMGSSTSRWCGRISIRRLGPPPSARWALGLAAWQGL